MPDIRTAEGREVILSRLRPVFPAMGSAIVEHGRPIAVQLSKAGHQLGGQLGKVSGRSWAGAGGGLIALAAIAWAVDKFLLSPPKKPVRKPVRARAAATRAPAARARTTTRKAAPRRKSA